MCTPIAYLVEEREHQLARWLKTEFPGSFVSLTREGPCNAAPGWPVSVPASMFLEYGIYRGRVQNAVAPIIQLFQGGQL